MTETRDKVIIEYASVNFDKTANDVKTLKGNLEGVTEVSFNTEKSTASLENKFASLERRFQTTAAQTAQYAKIQKDVNLAVANNPALQDRANEVLKAAEARYLGSGVAVKALAEAHKGLDAQGQAAFHSIRSVGEQLALGVSPVQALTGQINHLTFAASGQGGLAGAFGQVSTLARGMINPMTLAIGTTAILTAAAAALANQYDKVSVSSQRAIGGAGARTGTTTSDINSFVAKNASIGTSGLSDREARGLGESLTETGEIVIGRLHGMSDAVVGFANQTGKSVTEASKVFEDFGRDPLKGVQALTDAFGPLDAGQRKAVDSALQMHDKTALLNVVIDAFAEKARRAAENAGILDKVWRGITTFSGKETVGPGGPEDQMRAAQVRAAEAQDALLSATQQSAPAPVLDALSEHLAKATEEVEKFEAAVDKLKSGSAADALKQLSTEADNVDKALIPQIGAIDQLKTKIEELNRAKAAGTTSQYGASVDNAALQAAQNQLQALKESEAASARYNQRVAEIGASWRGVGQAVALQLQSMQNQLPVAQAWTEATRMRAQQQATYNDLIDKGRTSEEASLVAAKQYELSKASAEANAQKLVQSSQDQVDLIRAQGTGMEGVVQSSIAYRDAMQAGATSTQAAAIAANTLQASLAQAAQAETKALNSAQFQQLNSVDANGILDVTKKGRSQFAPDVMPSGPLSFSADPSISVFYKGGGAGRRIDVGDPYADIAAAGRARNANMSSSDYADMTLGAGGSLTGAISGAESWVRPDTIQTISSLYDLKNAQTNDKSTKISNLNEEMAWLQTQPQSIARNQAIVSLQQSIDQLKNATDANTAATQATLNPLYSGGHAAIGYFKAAGGLDMMAHGPTSGDQVPFHAMINGGERVIIQTKEQQRAGSNDNSRTVINNNNFVFSNTSTSNARRSQRQFAQGFGQMAAAGS